MIKNKKSKIPNFKSYEEEAKFWDTHDFTEFADELEDVDLVVQLNQPKETTLILRLQKKLKDRLVMVAKAKGVRVSALARMWITEKLNSRNSPRLAA